ncbi:MAG: hypothetical protein EF811_02205 [Methanonatronarchaeia archaeon]|nr:MAG: hypothetical protein EF811_02205 [Methanonatronarchaeia archaeon]
MGDPSIVFYLCARNEAKDAISSDAAIPIGTKPVIVAVIPDRLASSIAWLATGIPTPAMKTAAIAVPIAFWIIPISFSHLLKGSVHFVIKNTFKLIAKMSVNSLKGLISTANKFPI